MSGKNITIFVSGKGKTRFVKGMLIVPTEEQCGKPYPYPVILSIDKIKYCVVLN